MVYGWSTDCVRMAYGSCTDRVRILYDWCTDGVRRQPQATCKPGDWEVIATLKPPQCPLTLANTQGGLNNVPATRRQAHIVGTRREAHFTLRVSNQAGLWLTLYREPNWPYAHHLHHRHRHGRRQNTADVPAPPPPAAERLPRAGHETILLRQPGRHGIPARGSGW